MHETTQHSQTQHVHQGQEGNVNTIPDTDRSPENNTLANQEGIARWWRHHLWLGCLPVSATTRCDASEKPEILSQAIGQDAQAEIPTETPPPPGSESGSTTEPKKPRQVTLPPGLDSGDIVLFNRKCSKMNFYAALVCAASKMGSNSRWDHVGVVVKHPTTGELLFFEADFGGVKLRSLQERVCRSKSNEIAVRRLNIVVSDMDRQRLFDFANEMLGTPYETGPGTMIKSVIDPLAKQERERMHALLLEKKAQLREIDRELAEAALTLFQRRTLESERKRVAGNVAIISTRLQEEIKRSHSEIFEAQNDLSKVFCSELSAAAYQRLGLLESYPPAAGYNPKDFSSEQTNPPGLHLLRGARLSSEIYIREDESRREGDGKKKKRADEGEKQEEDISMWLWPRIKANPGKSQVQTSRIERVSEIKGIHDGDPPNRETRQLIRDVLKRTPLYASIPDEYKRSHLVKSFRAQIVNAGDILFRQGEYGDSFYVVDHGTLERLIQRPSPAAAVGPGSTSGIASSPSRSTSRAASSTSGGLQSALEYEQATLVSTLGPRTSCGMTGFAFNTPRTATIRAAEPTLVWRIDRASYERLRDAGSDTKDIFSRMDTLELREYVKEHFLFRNMDRIGPREIGAFFLVKFRAGELIFAQGDRGDNFYIIKSGEVQRILAHPKAVLKGKNKEQDVAERADVLVTTLGSGESFGELAIMYDAPRASTTRAKTDVEVWAISAESFHQLALGGGTQYLRAVFNRYASKTRKSAGLAYSRENEDEPVMTGKDLLRFARLDSMKIDSSTRKRLGALLLMLVTGNRHASMDDDIEAVVLDFWEFVRFDILLNQPNAELQFAFRLADRQNAGFVDLEELQTLLTEYAQIDPKASAILNTENQASLDLLKTAFGPDGQRVMQYKEFCKISKDILPPRFLQDIKALMNHMLHELEAPANEQTEGWMLFRGSGAGNPSTTDSRPGLLQRIGKLFETSSDATPESVIAQKPSSIASTQSAESISSTGNESMSARYPIDHLEELPHLVAIAAAGVVSRTVVAPLERAKILMQTMATDGKKLSLLRTLSWMVQKDHGSWIQAFYRGNGANVMRIAPASMVQLLLVEQFRYMAQFGTYMYSVHSQEKHSTSMTFSRHNPTVLDTVILSGLAGVIAAFITYPMDIVHCRLSVQTHSYHPYRGVYHAVSTGLKQHGLVSLFRGLTPTLLGVFPYVGISFAAYESIRPILPKLNDGSGKPTPGSAIACGMVSSLLAQLASYPLDTVRRCMQLSQTTMPLETAVSQARFASSLGAPLSTWGTMKLLVKEHGVRRLYRGWTPNFLKALPVSVVSYYTYELCREAIIQHFMPSRARVT